jgi:hypothetical protein
VGREEIVIPPEARPYAELQVGELDNFRDKPDWERLVDDLAQSRYDSIKEFLPIECHNILDIGGGVGVMDVPIMKHYYPVPKLAVLDGVWWEVGDKIKHDIPFNSPKATNELLQANGLRLETYITPSIAGAWKECPVVFEPFDLIVSFAAWGFHFSPATYLDFVMQYSHPGTRIVLDLRNGKEDWQEILQQQFKLISLAHSARKFKRFVYERV